MTENGNKPEFAFVIVKQTDGRYAVGNLDDDKADRQPTLDDIYCALQVVTRDLVAQQTATTILGALSSMQNPQETQGGVVVPSATSKFRKVERTR